MKRGNSSRSGVSSSFRMHLEISKDSLVSQLGEGRQVPLATRDVAKCLTAHSTAYAPRQRITQPETPVVASVRNRDTALEGHQIFWVDATNRRGSSEKKSPWEVSRS